MENHKTVETAIKQRHLKNESYFRAQKKVEKIIGFYRHLACYLIINLFIIVIIFQTHGWSDVWDIKTFSTALFWGIGLLFHAMGVWGPDLIFGKEWEQRKIKSYMEKYQKEQKHYE